VLHLLSIYFKTYQCAQLMPAMFTRSARVHVQALQPVIVHDLQDMRMAGDK
jgi:hypothetical protein